MKYNYMITEYLRRTVRVEAESEAEAYLKVQDLIDNEDVVLSADDFVDRDIETMSKFTNGSVDTNDTHYKVDDDFSKYFTWDEICYNAMGKGALDYETKVYDTARYNIGTYIRENFGINVEEAESPEEAIDEFLKEHPEVDVFSKDGHNYIKEA